MIYLQDDECYQLIVPKIIFTYYNSHTTAIFTSSKAASKDTECCCCSNEQSATISSTVLPTIHWVSCCFCTSQLYISSHNIYRLHAYYISYGKTTVAYNNSYKSDRSIQAYNSNLHGMDLLYIMQSYFISLLPQIRISCPSLLYYCL